MSKFCIMRFQKYKVGSVANIERHQKHRDRLKHRKHPEREGENRTWVQSPERTMTQVVRHTISEQQEQTGRKVRKDAVVLVEFVLTFSPEMEKSIDFDDWNEANIEWLERQFGKGKIIRYDLNADEQSRVIRDRIIGKQSMSTTVVRVRQLIMTSQLLHICRLRGLNG